MSRGSRRPCAHPPTYLIVAIDGLTDETNSVYQGARLAPALEGVRALADWKERSGHAPLSTCLRTRRAVGYKLRIYQTGFRCRVNLDGRNEFRKHVAETVRELAEIRIENRHRFGGVILD